MNSTTPECEYRDLPSDFVPITPQAILDAAKLGLTYTRVYPEV